MYNYWNENTSNNIFHFPVSIIELEFQPIGFMTCNFFVTFIGKLTQTLILTLFSQILEGFNRKAKNNVRFFFIKIRISVIFMHLRSKMTSEICLKAGCLHGKAEQNCLKVENLPPFFQKPLVYWKTKNTCKFSIVNIVLCFYC